MAANSKTESTALSPHRGKINWPYKGKKNKHKKEKRVEVDGQLTYLCGCAFGPWEKVFLELAHKGLACWAWLVVGLHI